jgi:hypothetical protein
MIEMYGEEHEKVKSMLCSSLRRRERRVSMLGSEIGETVPPCHIVLICNKSSTHDRKEQRWTP